MALANRLNLRHAGLIAMALSAQLASYWGLVTPYFARHGLSSPFPPGDFVLLLIATGCVALGAALLSCYFAPGLGEVSPRGIALRRRSTIIAHHALNLAATLLALFVGLGEGRLALSLLFPVAAGGVWFYFTLYKYQLWAGTLLLVTAAVSLPCVVLLHTVSYANGLLWREIALGQLTLLPLVRQVGLYGGLLGGAVVLLHWVRGVAWFVGMRHPGRHTLATWLGLRRARLVVASGYVVFLSLLAALRGWLPGLGRMASGGYSAFWLSLGGLMVVSLALLLTAERSSHYRLALGALWLAAWGLVLCPLLPWSG